MKKRKIVNLILILVTALIIVGLFLYATLASGKILKEEVTPDQETIAQAKLAWEEKQAEKAQLQNSTSSDPQQTGGAAQPGGTQQAAEEAPEETPAPTAEFVKGHYPQQEEGRYLDYYVYLPPGAEGSLPLIVFLHGDGHIANPDSLKQCGIVKKTQDIYGDNFPFILLLPCTREASWGGWITDVLKGLIDETVASYNVDPNKIIITGHSRGAIGTWEAVSDYGDYFSAAVPVSGATDIHSESFVNVPVWAICGECIDDYDTYYDWMKYQCDKVQNAGGEAKITIVIDANHADTEYEAYTEEVFDWMLAQ